MAGVTVSKNAPTHLVVEHAVIVRLAGRIMTLRAAKVCSISKRKGNARNKRDGFFL